MKKLFPLRTVLTTLAIVLFSTGYGQKINGKIADTSAKKQIPNAVVALLQLPDSTLYKFTRTNIDGAFSLTNIKPGDYLLMVSHPYYAEYLDKIQIDTKDEIDINEIPLLNKSKLLQEVIVKSGSYMRIKGDTIAYLADSFKVSANANVEELLKKLPGITVDKSGKITAMGETVTNVLVDGEEFFGDDPGLAIKNLRADAVKEVQVFDKKSEQATFTGIDDGNTQKTINLKLKEDKKRGYFGKIDMAGGLLKNIEDRYNTNIMASSFKGKRKISGYVLNGNTGQEGLSWQDNDKFGSNDNFNVDIDDGGGVSFNYTGGNSADDEPDVNTQNGFTKNQNIGGQYSNKWNDKHSFNFSPKYNEQVYSNLQNTYLRTYIGDSVLYYNSDKYTDVVRNNIKTSMIYEGKFDSSNSFKITNRINQYHTVSSENELAENKSETGTTKSISDNSANKVIDKIAMSGNAIFRHKFKKARRTFSISANWSLIKSNGDLFLNNITDINNGSGFYTVNTNQFIQSDKSTQSLGTKVTYTEPLSKKVSWEISNELAFSGGKNDQSTYAYNGTTNKYDESVDSLTNNFRNKIFTITPSTKFNYDTKKLKLNIGAGVGFTKFDLDDITFSKNYIRNFTNFFPAANATYTIKSNSNLRFRYNGNTTQPTINQLQPLRNNNDFLNQYIGNADLKPSFTHRINLSYNTYDFIKDRFIFTSLNMDATQNDISNHKTIYTQSGKTINQPINTNGNLSVSLWSGFGSKFKKGNIRYFIGPNLSYRKSAEIISTVDIVNSSEVLKTINSTTNVVSAMLTTNLSKSKDKKYDLTLNNDFGFNQGSSTLSTSNYHFMTNTLSAEATVYVKKVWSINSNYEYNYRQKTQGALKNLNNHLLNAKLQRNFKNDEFSMYVTARDILNQNIGVDMSFYSNTYSEVTNQRLRRYWMIGFVWNFKNKEVASTTATPPSPAPQK